jgi:hypothetical protein
MDLTLGTLTDPKQRKEVVIFLAINDVGKNNYPFFVKYIYKSLSLQTFYSYRCVVNLRF